MITSGNSTLAYTIPAQKLDAEEILSSIMFVSTRRDIKLRDEIKASKAKMKAKIAKKRMVSRWARGICFSKRKKKSNLM